MQTAAAKQYLPLCGKTVLDHTLQRLTTYARFKKIVVAVSKNDTLWPTTAWVQHERVMSIIGGETRFQSVLNGLKALQPLAKADDWVMVHDAARPCITHADLDALIEQVGADAVGGLLGTPVRDTMKRTLPNSRITHTTERVGLWHAFTPQMFRFKVLFDALTAALDKKQMVTDEASAVELTGAQPLMVAGRIDNIKITYPDDITLAELYVQQQIREGLAEA
jgi:2-C-methyl-D-erythritol 4-phosphate cytidylyltransferase